MTDVQAKEIGFTHYGYAFYFIPAYLTAEDEEPYIVGKYLLFDYLIFFIGFSLQMINYKGNFAVIIEKEL